MMIQSCSPAVERSRSGSARGLATLVVHRATNRREVNGEVATRASRFPVPKQEKLTYSTKGVPGGTRAKGSASYDLEALDGKDFMADARMDGMVYGLSSGRRLWRESEQIVRRGGVGGTVEGGRAV